MNRAAVTTRTAVALLAIIIVVAGVVVFLYPILTGPPTGVVPPAGIELKILTRHDTTIQLLFERTFLNSSLARQHNVTKIRWDYVDAPYWETILKTGEEDIAWGGGPTLFDIMANKGFFAPPEGTWALTEVNKVPDTFSGVRLKRFDGGKPTWTAAAISSFGIVVNKPSLQRSGLPAPQDWPDLGGPAFAKTLPIPLLSMADPLGSTSHTRIYEIILQALGWDDGWRLIARIAANAKIMSGSTEALTEITSGTVAAGPAIDFYGYSSHIDNPDIDYVLPKSTLVNGDPIALVTTTKNRAAAEAFIAFVLSLDGQKNWLNSKINRLPVREDVFETPEGQKRPELEAAYMAAKITIPVNFSDALAISYEFSMQNYFKAALIDTHDSLVSTWKKLVDASNQGRIQPSQFDQLARQLGDPLTIQFEGSSRRFTQDYAISISSRLLSDEVFKARFWEAVRAAAEQRYQDLLTSIP